MDRKTHFRKPIKPSTAPRQPCAWSDAYEESHLLCTACGRSYPVVDGIPVLIAERATMPTA
jgi:uncharacterized protein YbaR (Trm112 family)